MTSLIAFTFYTQAFTLLPISALCKGQERVGTKFVEIFLLLIAAGSTKIERNDSIWEMYTSRRRGNRSIL